MARYIDADALIESIQETLCSKCDKYDGIKCKSCGIDDTLDFLDTAPTADVALKSEVAREIFEEIERLLSMHFCSCLPKGATEHYDYYEGDIADSIAELKKKYTEGEG